jgi:acyl dehydratase
MTVEGIRGRWFEDLPVGFRVRHGITRTVTEMDNVLFTTVSMNPQPLHLDANYAAATEFGQVLVNSMFTLSLVIGLSVYELTLATTVANLGFSKIEFPGPVFCGDTIRVETEVVAARLSSSRPGQGIVTFEHFGYNQRDEVICDALRSALMKTSPS